MNVLCRRWRVVLGLAAFACGGTTAPNSAIDGGAPTDAGVDGATACGHAPPSPKNGHQPSGQTRSYAVNAFFMGDTGWDGSPNTDAWKSLGFDQDGVATTAPASMPNCMVLDRSAAHDQLLDGDCGVDNAFGHLLASGFTSSRETSLAQSGQWTLLVQINLNDGSDGQLGIEGGLMWGAPLSSPPKFDGNDKWPPTSDSVNPPGNTPIARWTGGYQVGGVIYTTDPIVLNFGLRPVAGRQPRFPIRVHTMALTLSPDLKAITRGVVAGIITNEDLNVAATPCMGGGPVDLARSTSDILSDQTADPNRACSGVSIGFGFTAVEVTLDNPAPGLPASCPDGG